MKKEKRVKSYKKRTESGRVVTVKPYTSKYDTEDTLKSLKRKKEGAKRRKNAGKELSHKKSCCSGC